MYRDKAAIHLGRYRLGELAAPWFLTPTNDIQPPSCDNVAGQLAKSRRDRPAFDKLLKAVTRREVDLVAAWSVDRLGRSLTDLLSFLGELHANGCDLYLHQQGLDTSTPAGRAMFQMMGVFAEFERSIIRERVISGLARAKAEGKSLGRPKVGSEVETTIKALRADGYGIQRIARTVGVGTSVVQRVVGAP